MYISNVCLKVPKLLPYYLEILFQLKKMIISALLVSLFASAVLCSDVLELTDETFASGTEGEDIMLVEFFAPW